MALKGTPDGWHSVTPRIIVDDVPKLVAFLKQVFGATGEVPEDRPAVIRIGDSLVMISETGPRDSVTAFLYVYVPDVDATYQRAMQAGAASIEPTLNTPYGDRRAMVKDPCGNIWQIATHMPQVLEG
jgi:PhnB protein